MGLFHPVRPSKAFPPGGWSFPSPSGSTAAEPSGSVASGVSPAVPIGTGTSPAAPLGTGYSVSLVARADDPTGLTGALSKLLGGGSSEAADELSTKSTSTYSESVAAQTSTTATETVYVSSTPTSSTSYTPEIVDSSSSYAEHKSVQFFRRSF